jgi:hypothetical protein
LKQIYLPRRNALIQEAIQFPNSHDPANKVYTTIYTYNDYELKVGKPGKEYSSAQIKYQDGHKANNPNDMSPTTFFQGQMVPRIGTFEEVFKGFIKLIPNYDALQLLGALCVRNAMALDHVQDNNGNWRYSPPTDVVDEIKKSLPADFGEPLEVFLYYLELIALNEDTKYFTLGYDIASGIGRYNNLLTYAHIINIVLHRRNLTEADFLLELMKFAGGLVRPPAGLNPISLKGAISAFPQLQP